MSANQAAKEHLMRLLFRHLDDWLDVQVEPGGKIIAFHWAGPPIFRMFVNHEIAAVLNENDPPCQTISDFMASRLPGLWGYMPEHERDKEICLKCGKIFTETVPAKQTTN